MRWLAVTLVVATCVAGAALAQDDAQVAGNAQLPVTESAPTAEAPTAFTPRWEEHSVRAVRMYPSNALERGMAGIVHLCCTARGDRRLSCRVAIEWPEHQSFGSTALRYSNGLRLTEASYAEFVTQERQDIQIAFRWQVHPVPAELDRIAEQVRAQATDLCGPGSGAPPEYIVIEARRL